MFIVETENHCVCWDLWSGKPLAPNFPGHVNAVKPNSLLGKTREREKAAASSAHETLCFQEYSLYIYIVCALGQ